MKQNKNLNFYISFHIFFVCFVLLFGRFIVGHHLFSNMNTRRHPEPRIPPDSRSVQILYRISGMLNESNRSHIGDVRFIIHYDGANENRQCQANFL